MVFKPEYQNFADNILQQIATSDRSGAELVFVGIHVRRTDYVQFSKVYLNKKVVGKTYFLEAIEYFQESYPDNQVYFIAVSDDLVWVRENICYLYPSSLFPCSGKEEPGKYPGSGCCWGRRRRQPQSTPRSGPCRCGPGNTEQLQPHHH